MLTVFAGRYFHYAAIRFIGPSRATAIRVSSPVVTGLLAFLFLGEKLTLPQYAGAGAVMAGIMLLIRETNRCSKRVIDNSDALVGSLSLVDMSYARASFLGSLSAVASASAYGSGHFMRKLALNVVPSPWWGMVIGSTVGWLCVLVLAWWQGNLKACFRSNLSLTSLPRFFVLAGCLNGLGQMFSFLAISFIAVSLASVIFAIEPLITAVFSRLVMGREELLGWRMLCGCFVTISGLLFVILL